MTAFKEEKPKSAPKKKAEADGGTKPKAAPKKKAAAKKED